MLTIIWGLLNLVLFLYFVIICFDAIKLIGSKKGYFAALVFIIGLVSIITLENQENLSKKTIDLVNQKKEATNHYKNSFHQDIVLEETISTKIILSISFGIDDNENKIIPLEANCFRTGFVSGTDYKISSIDVNKKDNENYFFYSINSVVEWKLLGIKLFSETKSFEGKALLKK